VSPEDAYRALTANVPAYLSFRDASCGTCSFALTLQHCFSAVQKAVSQRFLNFSSFNAEEYEFYDSVENGDFNWIIPGTLTVWAIRLVL